jgi:hypothetical protein
MIAATNREIRRHQASASERRSAARADPLRFLDRRIAALEAMHLNGLRTVPPTALPWLAAVNARLPAGLRMVFHSRLRIRDAIDQCFDLQERLLKLRDPGYGRLQVSPDEVGDDVGAGELELDEI